MKTKYIFFMVALLVISSSCLAQYYSGGHDSLLFDGANETMILPAKNAGDCYIRVIYARGTTRGTYYKTKTYEVCGEIVITTSSTRKWEP